MLNLFCPDLYIKNIYELDLNYIKHKNIKGLLVDIDNTLLSWNSLFIDDRLLQWIDSCRRREISLCILSNNKYSRIKHCSEHLNIPAVYWCFKPFKMAYKKGMDILGTKPEETAILGDQIFTDILGAKRMGIFAILVKPISNKELYWTRMIRLAERKLLKVMEKKNLITLHDKSHLGR